MQDEIRTSISITRVLYVIAGEGMELTDSTGSTIIHYAVRSMISCSDFDKMLSLITSFASYEQLARYSTLNWLSNQWLDTIGGLSKTHNKDFPPCYGFDS